MLTGLIVIFGLLLLKLVFQVGLNSLNQRHVIANQDEIPEAFKGQIDKETYGKSTAYTLAKSKFESFELVFDTVLLAAVLWFLPKIYGAFTGLIGITVWQQTIVFIALSVVLSLPAIPLEWWEQFKLEEKFGFNKSNIKLWVTDKFKGALIGFALGAPLLYALLKFIDKFPTYWWLFGFILLFSFQLLMMVLAPMIIMPLFNKLSPLPDGELKDRLMALSDKTGFKAKTIQVIDGSKRSGHSNAFFTGFGRFRRIVLYDTLIDQLNTDELEGVLAHEIGHYKLGHVPQMLCIFGVSGFLGFWLLYWLSSNDWFYVQFGFEMIDGKVPALLLFSLLSGLFTFWLTPLTNLWSRKNEFQADAFAKNALSNADPLIRALRVLSEKNLSNLNPHPFYSSFYYSHPTIQEREKALLK